MASSLAPLLSDLRLAKEEDGGEETDPLPDASAVEAAASARVGRPVRLVTTASAATSAVEHLRRHPTLAVDCEGVSLSRTGRLCTVQVASPTRAYVFDLVANADVLRPGAADLLTDAAVVKVFHDCRRDADALAHQAGVWVEGVRDTQVAFELSRLDAGRPRPLPVSLTALLRLHVKGAAGGGTAAAAALKARIKARYATTPNLWELRPLDAEALTYATNDVVHLVAIHEALAATCAPRRAAARLAAAAAAHAAAYRDLPEEVSAAAAAADFDRLRAAADAGRPQRLRRGAGRYR